MLLWALSNFDHFLDIYLTKSWTLLRLSLFTRFVLLLDSFTEMIVYWHSVSSKSNSPLPPLLFLSLWSLNIHTHTPFLLSTSPFLFISHITIFPVTRSRILVSFLMDHISLPIQVLCFQEMMGRKKERKKKNKERWKADIEGHFSFSWQIDNQNLLLEKI